MGDTIDKQNGLNWISVKGFKSLVNESSIELRPLTILAGSNSSGKSSIMQPILLMKQTLASSYDPGALLLNGPHARFTSVEQMLSREGKNRVTDTFSIELGTSEGKCKLLYQAQAKKPGFQISSVELLDKATPFGSGDFTSKIRNGITNEEIREIIARYHIPASMEIGEFVAFVTRTFCFLQLEVEVKQPRSRMFVGSDYLAREINRMIHLPGLRGNPERTYTTTAVDELDYMFRGTFERYTASIINHWQETGETDKLMALGRYMKLLALADQVTTRQINDTEVEVFVSRTSNVTGEEDWVSIADVGLGVSQTLPIIVALLFAEKDQLVYIEQPEIHLHPRAQYNLAKLLADAAARGVKVVIETHSSILLRGIQTLVASDELNNDLVALHWFTRDKNGQTVITSAELDEIGAFGDWPEDFAEVELAAEMRYLDAVENKEMGNGEEEQ